MSGNVASVRARDLAAAQLVAREAERLLVLAEEVAGDVGDDPRCRRLVADARLAAELARRLDDAVVLPDPVLEELDRPLLVLVALGAVGLYRATRACRVERRRALAARVARRHLVVAEAGGAS